MRERLRSLAVFADVGDAALDRLAAAASELDAPAGQTLIERRHPASGLFVLEDGVAVVEIASGTVELGRGDVFGEIAILGRSELRTARVRAKTAVRCLTFPRAAVEGVLADEPALAERLARLADERLPHARA